MGTSVRVSSTCTTSEGPTDDHKQGPPASTDFIGVHDCSSAESGTPKHGGCDAAFHDLANRLGDRGGWVLLLGEVGGRYEDGYAVGPAINFDAIPDNMSILLRVDSKIGQTLPPVRDDGDIEAYADAVLQFLTRCRGWEKVGAIQFGNELDQYRDQYADYYGPGAASCDYWFANPDLAYLDEIWQHKSVQFGTPERYAKLFVAVVKKLRDHGITIPLVTAPPMPNFFMWNAALKFRVWDSNCADRSIGDYLHAIEAEAARRGVTDPVGGIGVHLQGVGFADSKNAVSNQIRGWINDHLNDARSLTAATPVQGEGYTVVRSGGKHVPGNLPLYVGEIHPPPPFWQVSDQQLRTWIAGTVDGVRQHNAAGQNPVRSVIYYRWYPSGEEQSLAYGQDRRPLLVETLAGLAQ